jgi:hypothetical protein
LRVRRGRQVLDASTQRQVFMQEPRCEYAEAGMSAMRVRRGSRSSKIASASNAPDEGDSAPLCLSRSAAGAAALRVRLRGYEAWFHGLFPRCGSKALLQGANSVSVHSLRSSCGSMAWIHGLGPLWLHGASRQLGSTLWFDSVSPQQGLGPPLRLMAWSTSRTQ